MTTQCRLNIISKSGLRIIFQNPFWLQGFTLRFWDTCPKLEKSESSRHNCIFSQQIHTKRLNFTLLGLNFMLLGASKIKFLLAPITDLLAPGKRAGLNVKPWHQWQTIYCDLKLIGCTVVCFLFDFSFRCCLWYSEVWYRYCSHVCDATWADHEVHHSSCHGWYHCHLWSCSCCPYCQHTQWWPRLYTLQVCSMIHLSESCKTPHL